MFLVNPAAENGATGRRWPELAHTAASLGLRGDALLSERPGQLAELARQAADGGASLLVVVGGDGTVNEVVNGIAGRDDVELAVIPAAPAGTSSAPTASRAASRTPSRSRCTVGRA